MDSWLHNVWSFNKKMLCSTFFSLRLKTLFWTESVKTSNELFSKRHFPNFLNVYFIVMAFFLRCANSKFFYFFDVFVVNLRKYVSWIYVFFRKGFNKLIISVFWFEISNPTKSKIFRYSVQFEKSPKNRVNRVV